MRTQTHARTHQKKRNLEGNLWYQCTEFYDSNVYVQQSLTIGEFAHGASLSGVCTIVSWTIFYCILNVAIHTFIWCHFVNLFHILFNGFICFREIFCFDMPSYSTLVITMVNSRPIKFNIISTNQKIAWQNPWMVDSISGSYVRPSNLSRNSNNLIIYVDYSFDV